MTDSRSFTVRLSQEQWASLERLVAERGISISEATAEAIDRLLKQDQLYSTARERALVRLQNAPSLGTNGVITWTRDEIHER